HGPASLRPPPGPFPGPVVRASLPRRARARRGRPGAGPAPATREGRGGAAPAHLFFAGGGSAGCAVRRILTGFTGARGSTAPPDPAGRSVFRRPPTRRTGPVRPAGGGVPPGRRVPAGPDVGPGTVAVVRPSARTEQARRLEVLRGGQARQLPP